MIKHFIHTFFLLTATSLSAVSLAQMTPDEQKACGIAALTSEQKEALESWLANAKEKPQPTLKSSKIHHGEFVVTANIKMGRFITLNNGITYDIPSRSRKKTMGWKVDEKVLLIEPVHPTNFKLENVSQKQTIGAKISTKTP